MVELRAFGLIGVELYYVLQNSEWDPAGRNGRIRRTVLDAWREGRADVRKTPRLRRRRTRPGSLHRSDRARWAFQLDPRHTKLRTPGSLPAPTPDIQRAWPTLAHRRWHYLRSRVGERTRAKQDSLRPMDRPHPVSHHPRRARAIPVGARFDRADFHRLPPKRYRQRAAFRTQCNPRDRQESRLAWGSSLSHDEAGEDRPARQSLRGFRRLVRGRHNLRNASPAGILEHDLIIQSDPRAAVAEKLEDYG